jgi:hypothetical protein
MAKPIPATPIVKGRDAERIAKEIREGTPSTAQRSERLRQADETYRRMASATSREPMR